MREFIPLLQTILWILLILWFIKFFRPELKLLREVLVKRLESGGYVKIGPVEIGELKNQVETVRQQLDDVNQKVSDLFLATMSPSMYFNLKKFARGHFDKYEMTKMLERELYHLRDIGYIDIESIKAIPKMGENLSDYVTITTTGKNFVTLRESIKKDESIN